MSRDIIPIYTDQGVPPFGPYSQAMKAAGIIYLNGQTAADNTGKLVEGTVAEKTHKMCQNVKTVLEAAGGGLERVVKVTVYFATLDDFNEMNEV